MLHFKGLCNNYQEGRGGGEVSYVHYNSVKRSMVLSGLSDAVKLTFWKNIKQSREFTVNNWVIMHKDHC